MGTPGCESQEEIALGDRASTAGLRNSATTVIKDAQKTRKHCTSVKKVTFLKCLYTNADQLKNKLSELELRMKDETPSIIGVTEVSPKARRADIRQEEYSLESLRNFKIFSKNLNKAGARGLLMYINEDLESKEVKLKSSFEEYLAIEIKLNKSDRLLCTLLYRSDSGSDNNNERLNELFREISSSKYSHIMVMGDFNYPEIDWDTMSAPGGEARKDQLFLDAVRDSYLFQHITAPTRWRSHERANTLDLVFTNEQNMVEDLAYDSPLGKSDHMVLRFRFIAESEIEERVIERRKYDYGDYASLKRELRDMSFDEVLRATTVDENWDNMLETIHSLEEKHIPLSRINTRKKSSYKFPLKADTREMMKEKNKLAKKACHGQNPEIRKKYNRIRNKVKKLVERERKDFEKSISRDAKKKPKVIWNYIKSKSKTKVTIENLHIDPLDPASPKVKDATLKANILSEFFASVFCNEDDSSIPDVMPTEIEFPMPRLEITEEGITAILKDLKSDKSPGLDKVHPAFLKNLCVELAVPLKLIFDQSLTSGEIPEGWKKARVCPIHKKGDKSLANNYRPVSLTSIVCKVMEKLVRKHIMEHLAINKILTDCQYGFIPGRSISIQLLRLLDEWTEYLEKGESVDCVYLDLRKAFDKVPHKRLLKKVESYGIAPELMKWLESFLSKRTQQVSLCGAESDWKYVTSGIPQGSVLGPVLFLLFVNDLPVNLSSNVMLFADDTKLYSTQPQVLQEDINILKAWSEQWLLEFNTEKCKHMHIGRDPAPSFTLNEKELETVDEEKDLGIIFDTKLSFGNHISSKVKKANQMYAMIRRTFRYLDHETFKPLYKAMVRSHLEFASSVFHPYKVADIDLIESVQRRATKQLPGLRNLSYPERLKKLRLPTLAYRRVRGDMIEMYKALSEKYDRASTLFIHRWEASAARHSTRTNSRKIFPQHASNNRRKNVFQIRSASIWNALPDNIVCAPNTNTFKNRLDKHWSNRSKLYDNHRANIEELSVPLPTDQTTSPH